MRANSKFVRKPKCFAPLPWRRKKVIAHCVGNLSSHLVVNGSNRSDNCFPGTRPNAAKPEFMEVVPKSKRELLAMAGIAKGVKNKATNRSSRGLHIAFWGYWHRVLRI